MSPNEQINKLIEINHQRDKMKKKIISDIGKIFDDESTRMCKGIDFKESNDTFSVAISIPYDFFLFG